MYRTKEKLIAEEMFLNGIPDINIREKLKIPHSTFSTWKKDFLIKKERMINRDVKKENSVDVENSGGSAEGCSNLPALNRPLFIKTVNKAIELVYDALQNKTVTEDIALAMKLVIACRIKCDSNLTFPLVDNKEDKDKDVVTQLGEQNAMPVKTFRIVANG